MIALNILIAEDHEWTTLGLKVAIEKASIHKVVGTADNGQTAVNLAQELRPDIILMDIEMPKLDGISATRKIKEILPDIKILMLTSYKNEENIASALSAGANAYCLKDIKVERLVQVMEMVVEGATWFDPGISDMLTKLLLTANANPRIELDAQFSCNAYRELTPRELDVLEYIALGKSNKEIAEALNITIHTVKIHVSNILEKMAVEDRTQLAIKALQERLVKGIPTAL